MKINRIKVLALFIGATLANPLWSKDNLSPPALSKDTQGYTHWNKDSKAIYDLLMAQLQQSSADYSGSVDTLVKYAKSQKNEKLLANAYRTLLQTERYVEAIDIAETWKTVDEKGAEPFYILALALNNETERAVAVIQKTLKTGTKSEKTRRLMHYIKLLMGHWYRPEIVSTMGELRQSLQDEEIIDDTLLSYAYVSLLRWQGHIEKAVQIIDEELFNDPKNLNLIQAKSDAYRYTMRLDEAEQVWKKLLSDYPNEPLFQFGYAQFLYDRYDFQHAAEVLATIEQRDIAFSVNMLEMMCQVQLGKYATATQFFDQKRLTEEERQNAQYNYADLLLAHKQYALAQTALESIDDNSELYLPALLKIGQIKYADSINAGDQWFDQIKDQLQLSDTQFIREKANALQSAGRDKVAYERINDYVEANPNHETMRYTRGLMAAELGLLDKSIADLKKLHADSPSDSDVQNALGYTLLGQPETLNEGIKLVKKSLFMQPSSAAVVDSMGWAHYQQGQPNQSLPFFRYAYANHVDGEIIGHYISALFKAGQPDVAKALYRLETQYPPNVEKIERFIEPIKRELAP